MPIAVRRKELALVALLVAFGLGGLALVGPWSGEQGGRAADRQGERASPSSPSPPPPGGVDRPVAAPREPLPASRPDAPRREAVATPGSQLAGRVALPADAAHEREMVVVTRGRVRHERFERRAPVDPALRFRLELPRGASRVELDLEAPHLYLARPLRVDLAEAPGEVLLEPRLGGGLVVRLEDRDGVVPRAAVGTTVEMFVSKVRRDATVDAQGRARFDGLMPGTVQRFSCNVPGFVLPADPDAVHVRAGVREEIRLVLAREVRVSGRVLDPEGAPLDAARVVAVRASRGSRVYDKPTLADPEGRFHLRGLRRGAIVLHAGHPEHLPARLDLGELEEGEERVGVELRLGAAQRIAGTVFWPDRRPAAWVLIDVEGTSRGPRSPASLSEPHRARSDEDGRFEVGGLAPGPHQVRASTWAEGPPSPGQLRPKLRAQAKGVLAGELSLALVLAEATRIQGRVIDDAGAPCTRGGTVLARRVTDGVGGEVVRRKLGADGSFDLEGLEPGPYEVAATVGAGLGDVVRIDQPGGDAEVILVAPRGARVSGRVLAGGAGAAGARVQARFLCVTALSGFDGGFDLFRMAETDEQGGFVLEQVAAGEHVLIAEQEELGLSDEVTLEVASGGEVEGLLLELHAPGWIEGWLSDGLSSHAGSRLEVKALDSSMGSAWPIDSTGRFKVPHLREGAYALILHDGDFPSRRNLACTTVEVFAGRGTSVVLSDRHRAARVLGRVHSGGEAVADASVVAAIGSGTERATTRTDGSGSFELDLPHGGWVHLSIGGWSDSDAEPPFVADGARVELVFELPTLEVAGQVLDRDGRPAAGALVRLEDEDGFSSRASRANDQGLFLFAHVVPARYVVSGGGSASDLFGSTHRDPPVPGADFGYRRSAPFDLAEGQGIGDLRLVLPAAGSVRGRLSSPAGRPPPDEIWLFATPIECDHVPIASEAEIRGDRYHLRGLGPGTYRIHGSCEGAPLVTLTEGQDLVLDLELD